MPGRHRRQQRGYFILSQSPPLSCQLSSRFHRGDVRQRMRCHALPLHSPPAERHCRCEIVILRPRSHGLNVRFFRTFGETTGGCCANPFSSSDFLALAGCAGSYSIRSSICSGRLSACGQHADSQQVELRPAVHLSLDQLDAVHMTLGASIVPFKFHGRFNRCRVAHQAFGK